MISSGKGKLEKESKKNSRNKTYNIRETEFLQQAHYQIRTQLNSQWVLNRCQWRLSKWKHKKKKRKRNKNGTVNIRAQSQYLWSQLIQNMCKCSLRRERENGEEEILEKIMLSVF